MVNHVTLPTALEMEEGMEMGEDLEEEGDPEEEGHPEEWATHQDWVCIVLGLYYSGFRYQEKIELWQKRTSGKLLLGKVKAKQSQLPSAAHVASSLGSPSVSLPFSGHNAAMSKFQNDDDVHSSKASSKQKIKAYSGILPPFLPNLSLMQKRL
ncbi:hypothetical protein DUI87_05894 [Hirundo rustica rustica]|uniref:Uncharacterized protein n=1 Tax=Hirundo rustica rustica TaxID=333673 RepID=A0A3M0KVX4_HIRRU|nr:hypothetical protein DUI87_05894 [Hirundo rustica rustica]